MKLIIFSQDLQNQIYGVNNIIVNLKKNLIINNKIYVEIINIKNILFKFDKIKKSKLIHIHGCWSPIHFFIFLLSKIYKKKIFFSPHGMLMSSALNIKKIKKKIAFKIYQRIILDKSDNIIVNSKEEMESIKKLSKNKKISIILHGIEFNKQFFNKKKNRNLKFVSYSRIHPIKGLIELVSIWKNSEYLQNFSLHLYGKIDDYDYFNKLKPFFNKNIKYLGEINSKNKYKILSNYKLMIYPSFSENFGMIILESLNAGLYVLMRKNLPWKNLNKKFGDQILINKKNLEKSIKNFIKKENFYNLTSNKKLLKKYLIKNFDWKNVTNSYYNNYKI